MSSMINKLVFSYHKHEFIYYISANSNLANGRTKQKSVILNVMRFDEKFTNNKATLLNQGNVS